MMLHTKYEDSRPCGFRQEDFFMVFSIQAYVKHVNPGASQFWPQGYNLNKLGRGSLDDATTRHRALIFGTIYLIWYKYQGSMPCGFRQEDFFMVFPI